MSDTILQPGDVVLDAEKEGEVIDTILQGRRLQTGWVSRDLTKVPHGSQGRVRSFPSELLRSWDEIKDSIRERAEKKERASDFLIARSIPGTHQGNTNFCWYHSAVQPMRTRRAKMGLPFVNLCAAYGACRVQNFRNEGYWTTAAVKDLMEYGTVSVDAYPENAFNRSKHREAASADHHLITDAVDIETWQQLCSLLTIADGQGGGGWDWMGHAMELVEPTLVNNAVALRVRDNYYGDRDMYVIEGSERRVCPSDMVGILGITVKKAA